MPGAEAVCVAFNPETGHLAVATGALGRPGEVKLWNLAQSHEPRTLHGHADAVTALAFGADGRRLATAGADGKVKYWDVASGHEAHTLHAHDGGVRSVACSPDGSRLAMAGADEVVAIWDTASKRRLFALPGKSGEVWGLAFSPDGKRFATAGVGSGDDSKQELEADWVDLPNLAPAVYAEGPNALLSTNADGRITIPALIPGATYRIVHVRPAAEKDAGAMLPGERAGYSTKGLPVTDFTARAGAAVELPDITDVLRSP